MSTNGKFVRKLTHTVSSNSDGPHPDGDLKNTDRKKIMHHRCLYEDMSDPVVFMSVPVNTSGRLYNDFLCLFFFHVHRETSILVVDFSPGLVLFRQRSV